MGGPREKYERTLETIHTLVRLCKWVVHADGYKFEVLSPDVVVKTHRGTGMQDSKEVTESHRSLPVFQKWDGRGQVVATAQLHLPITH